MVSFCVYVVSMPITFASSTESPVFSLCLLKTPLALFLTEQFKSKVCPSVRVRSCVCAHVCVRVCAYTRTETALIREML